MSQHTVNIFWFRRDLRLDDNTALYHALKDDHPVLPLFIFDTVILDDLEDKDDARVTFIYDELISINEELKKKNSGILILHGTPENVWKQLIKTYEIGKVYTNRDYEPYARKRDEAVKKLLSDHDITLHSYKDQVIFERDEIVKDNGEPYVVFTPYSKLWRSKATSSEFNPYTSALHFSNFYQGAISTPPELNQLGFKRATIDIPDKHVTEDMLSRYAKTRDYPAEQGTSRLSVHLRFGTISIRKLMTQARSNSHTFTTELIWREFYQMILWHFPQVVDHNFKRKYDKVSWRTSESDFKHWCEGTTGYPLVDAGMRQLNTTGFMHNRVRMVTASFLTKHLLIDWRWGEAYFARKLLDYDLASNNGGWQWAAGTGTDAQPYFRIFNPESQMQKFDPQKAYIKEWIPEYDTPNYPTPIVEHKRARERALDTFKKALG